MTIAPASTVRRGRPPIGGQRSMERGELGVVFENIPSYSPYVPGLGPRLQPITLVPPRDSTAYIIDEILVHHTHSRDKKKRLQYHLRWTDLPAASLIVDAENIRDYVSAKEYEDWNVKQAAEREEEETRQAILAVRLAGEDAKLKEERRVAGIVLRNGTFRPNQLDEPATRRPATPQPGEKKRRGRPRKSQPSLSTPQKTKFEHFEDMETDLDTSDEKAILRQLNADSTESETNLQGEKRNSHERNGGLWASGPPHKKPRGLAASPIRGDARRDPVSASHRAVVPPARAAEPPARQAIAKTPVNTHHIQSQSRPNQGSPGPSTANLNLTNGNSRPSASFTPAGRSSGTWNSLLAGKPVTPVPIPSYAHNLLTDKPTTKKTPKPQPKAKPSPREPKMKGGEEVVENDQVYVIKRLEDVQHWEIGGKIVRHFKVRWEGTWPKDQNPTWEPEENLPKDMVRKFMLKRPLGFDGAADKMDGLSISPLGTRMYSSVSEAFQGEVEDAMMMGTEPERNADSENEDNEMLLVTNEPLSSYSYKPALDMALGRAY